MGEYEDFGIKEEDLLDLDILFKDFKNEILDKVELLYINDINFVAVVSSVESIDSKPAVLRVVE